jgi:hypothetical protein
MIATLATNKNSLKFKIIIIVLFIKKQLMTIGHGGVVVGTEVHIHLVFIV